MLSFLPSPAQCNHAFHNTFSTPHPSPSLSTSTPIHNHSFPHHPFPQLIPTHLYPHISIHISSTPTHIVHNYTYPHAFHRIPPHSTQPFRAFRYPSLIGTCRVDMKMSYSDAVFTSTSYRFGFVSIIFSTTATVASVIVVENKNATGVEK